MSSQFLPTRAQQLAFVAKSEPWCEYELEDGTIVRARLIMTKIIDRGSKDQQTGLPLLELSWQQVLDVTFPDAVINAANAEKRKA